MNEANPTLSLSPFSEWNHPLVSPPSSTLRDTVPPSRTYPDTPDVRSVVHELQLAAVEPPPAPRPIQNPWRVFGRAVDWASRAPHQTANAAAKIRLRIEEPPVGELPARTASRRPIGPAETRSGRHPGRSHGRPP